MMNFIQINETNRNDFAVLLPPPAYLGGSRASLGAYDDAGALCGAASLQLLDDSYELDWLYVVPERRRSGSRFVDTL